MTLKFYNCKVHPEPKDDTLWHFHKWKLSRIVGTLKESTRSKFRHAIKGLITMHFGKKYEVCILNGYWFMGICPSHRLHKLQKWRHSDLILCVLCSAHLVASISATHQTDSQTDEGCKVTWWKILKVSVSLQAPAFWGYVRPGIINATSVINIYKL